MLVAKDQLKCIRVRKRPDVTTAGICYETKFYYANPTGCVLRVRSVTTKAEVLVAAFKYSSKRPSGV